MFAGDSVASNSQPHTKSLFDSFLTNQNHHSISDKFLSQSFNLESDELEHFNTTSVQVPQFNPNHSPHLLSHLQGPSDINENSCLEYSDNSNDFNYSQKLFHIADGNLYSIFSPIQGRSYGMKPSFLRRQKYTVQECHGRGRRNFRKGLKFHNFLPSESTTSEKDASHVRTRWKIHSECRLREEHGTKQITISNWSQSSPEEPELQCLQADKNDFVPKPCTKLRLVRDTGNNSNDNADPYDFNLSLHSIPSENSIDLQQPTLPFSKTKDLFKCSTSKKDSLNFVVNSLLDKPSARENRHPICDNDELHTKSFYQSQKHRRKPIQTRRVVPYMKYLSIMEESDSIPLDLSSKCANEKSNSKYGDECRYPNSSRSSSTNCNEMKNSEVFSKPYLIPNTILDTPNVPKNNLYLNSPLASLLQSQIPPPLAFMPPPPMGNSNNFLFPVQPADKLSQSIAESLEKPGLKLNQKQFKIKKNWFPSSTGSHLNIQSSNNNHCHIRPAPPHCFTKESSSRSRRRNQRSVIKQKLEDTFKQNGFLVKTKQVSDGEATFCKFRQLRKYTRYYLKNWQQHLPDEVHKMWKGFLPPKTVLPSVSEAGSSLNTMS